MIQPNEIDVDKKNKILENQLSELDLQASQYINITNVHVNTDQQVIITTEDKIKISLEKHKKSLENKQSWIAPLGILFTISATLATTEFKDFILDANTWGAIFVISGVINIVWLLWSIKGVIKNTQLEDIISSLKNKEE